MNSANAALWSQFEGQPVDNTYRLNRLIGVGGFAGVFEADHVVEGRTLRRVAVKLILADPESMQRQLDELVAATMLQHPHVLRCFHAGSAIVGRSKLLYLVMEIAEDSLQSRLAKGVLPLPEAAEMTEQVASALAHLHRQNLVHRDVKAANVLLVGGQWKLSDFGTVRQSAGTATSHTMGVIGTVGYMPPESFEGTVSAAWDAWSLGVVVLESLTGKRPYAETSENELIGAILRKSPTIPAGLPEPFGEIVRRCLVRNHRERWSAQQILDELKRSVAVKVRELIAAAQRYRDAGSWEEALQVLREAQQIDATSAEIPRLIAEIGKQRQDAELRQRLNELRVRAAATGDLDNALQIWREVLRVDPRDAAAKAAVAKILEQQRVTRLKIEIKQALDQDDHPRASSLMAELHGRKPAPAPSPNTIAERSPRKRSLWPWLAALAAVALVAALLLWIWNAQQPSPDSSKRDAGAPPPVVSKPAEQSPPQTPSRPPVDLDAHFKKAAQLHEQGMYDAAIAEYDAILKEDPGNARATAGRARSVKAKEAEANVQK
jgi:serine/threonine protein kinase